MSKLTRFSWKIKHFTGAQPENVQKWHNFGENQMKNKAAQGQISLKCAQLCKIIRIRWIKLSGYCWHCYRPAALAGLRPPLYGPYGPVQSRPVACCTSRALQPLPHTRCLGFIIEIKGNTLKYYPHLEINSQPRKVKSYCSFTWNKRNLEPIICCA